MDTRDDGEEPRRAAHRGEQRRILDPFTEIQQRHSKLLVGVPLDERSARSASPTGRSLDKCKPDAKRKRDSAQPQEKAQQSRDDRSARITRPTGRSFKECKPDAKRKRDSAQPQERAQRSNNDDLYDL